MSAVVLIPKHDGSHRFCNDFRKLHEVLTFKAYPMPRVDELVRCLGQASFIMTLTSQRMYWQVPLTTCAREKTAFLHRAFVRWPWCPGQISEDDVSHPIHQVYFVA